MDGYEVRTYKWNVLECIALLLLVPIIKTPSVSASVSNSETYRLVVYFFNVTYIYGGLIFPSLLPNYFLVQEKFCQYFKQTFANCT